MSILVFSQNDLIEESNRLNESIRIQNEINKLDSERHFSEDLSNSQTNQSETKRELPEIPEGIHPQNNTFFDNSIDESNKPSFDNKEYNVEKYYEKNNDGSYSSKDEYKKNDVELEGEIFNNSTPKQKLFQVIIIVFGWFVLGFILNFIFYSNTPEHLVGKSETARYFHIIINIITAFLIFKTIL